MKTRVCQLVVKATEGKSEPRRRTALRCNRVTIDEHQQRYDADYASILAPAFRGDRVAERARMNRAVALLDVALLSDVVRQHEVAPLDLDAAGS